MAIDKYNSTGTKGPRTVTIVGAITATTLVEQQTAVDAIAETEAVMLLETVDFFPVICISGDLLFDKVSDVLVVISSLLMSIMFSVE